MLGIHFINNNDEYESLLIVNIFIDKTEYKIIDDFEGSKISEFEYILQNKIEQFDDRIICETKILFHSDILYSSKRKINRLDNNRETSVLVKRMNKVTIYEALERIFPSRSSWGTLVGIRPVKIVHEFLDKNYSIEEIKNYFRELKLSEQKIELACDIANRERAFVSVEHLDELSLYISIPFCPSRCYYCSFPSNDLTKKRKLIPRYLDTVLYEVKQIVEYFNNINKKFDCVYIGGGTPAVLTEDELEYFLTKINESISLCDLKEFTYEAGRVDVINKRKLEILKSKFVTRICLNPQTFNDKTLQKIGRFHSVDEFYNIFKIANGMEFNSINLDLILGLVGESFQDMKYSIERAIELAPENITVHTLAVKRASIINEKKDSNLVAEATVVEKAIEYMYSVMHKNGYVPYYMYRQKNMVGNFENVGFCKKDKESLYNIRIMEERHSIIALGAGAVSKIVCMDENRFERHATPKGLEFYLENYKKYLDEHINTLDYKFNVEN